MLGEDPMLDTPGLKFLFFNDTDSEYKQKTKRDRMSEAEKDKRGQKKETRREKPDGAQKGQTTNTTNTRGKRGHIAKWSRCCHCPLSFGCLRAG